MKKVAKLIAYLIIAVVVIVIAGVCYITLALPNVGKPEDIKVEVTPQRLARGKYLTLSVSQCLDCHSAHDDSKFSGPLLDTVHLGGGGQVFGANIGFPGNLIAANLTPYNLKSWTDGEIFRAITTGVKKDGSTIFPLMPWPYYAKMDREDLYSIIAYIRSLKPIEASYPKSTVDFPLNIIMHTMPEKATLGTKPDPKDTVKYGEYLVQSAACQECHSQDDKGKYLPGLQFAGGKEFKVNGNTLRTANISPDAATGIGSWTKQQFITRFKAYNDRSKAVKVGKKDFQTIMPWYQYSQMTEGDLASIYAYLRTVTPVKNAVVKFVVN
ncbi:MAG TPA: c-type cytochrome [Mucilaginibacter sp.]|jgi:mono/diheme cytochrome c family protein|nr:c-type cytochrome [Mucilaginibacter sp.]